MNLSGRSSGELVVLLIGATVCGVLVFTALSVLVLELAKPDADTEQITATLGEVMATMIGVIAGFLAGRTEGTSGESPPDSDHV